jgi:transposase-like protein
VEQKKGQRYGKEFQQQAVERTNACGNVVALARELGIARRVLYNWRDRVDETNPPPNRVREVMLRKQILKLFKHMNDQFTPLREIRSGQNGSGDWRARKTIRESLGAIRISGEQESRSTYTGRCLRLKANCER